MNSLVVIASQQARIASQLSRYRFVTPVALALDNLSNRSVRIFSSNSKDTKTKSATPKPDYRKTRELKGPYTVKIATSPLDQILGEKFLPKNKILPKVKEYVESNHLRDPLDEKSFIPDDKWQRIFPGEKKLTYLCLKKKSFQKHLKDLEKGSDAEIKEIEQKKDKLRDMAFGPDSAAKKKDMEKKKKERKQVVQRLKESKTGLYKPLKLSPEMKRFIGHETMARPDLVTFIWKYAKDNNLFRDKVIHVDTKLAPLVDGRATLAGTDVMKIVSAHIIKEK